jgi:hypothetical protein
MKSLFVILVFMILIGMTSNQQEDHTLFTEILQDYVHDGKVNYRELCQDNRLETYIAQLAATNPDTISDEKASLAFWINAYNAYTIKVICDNYPINSINELHTGGMYIGTILNKTIWDKDFVIINNQKTTLNHIEHEIIRPLFQDPRAHFALVCASKSCPPLRSESYEGYKLEEQLDDQGRIFFKDSSNNFFEIDKKEAHLSKILDWYSKDFGKKNKEILLYITRFLPDDLAATIKANPEGWDINHTKYDWSLNE